MSSLQHLTAADSSPCFLSHHYFSTASTEYLKMKSTIFTILLTALAVVPAQCAVPRNEKSPGEQVSTAEGNTKKNI